MKKFVILLIVLLPFATMATILRSLVVEPEQGSRLTEIPLQIGDWRGTEISIDLATASSLKASETLLRDYALADGTLMGLFIGYFRDQKYGSQIHSPRHCLPGGGWVVTNLERVTFDLGYKRITVNRMTIAKRAVAEQMFYWFESRSGDLTSEFALKFDLMKNSLLLSPTDAAMIRLTIPQQGRSTEECQRIAEGFIQSCIANIDNALPFKER